jgi:hypothetical protein
LHAQVADLVGSNFQVQAEQLRKDLAGSEQYSEITESDRAAALALLDRLETRLDGVSEVSTLPEQAKVSVFNDQEALNAILTGAAADSRQSCRREHVVGSNRRQNVCMTVAERRRRAEQSREYVGDIQRMFPGEVKP